MPTIDTSLGRIYIDDSGEGSADVALLWPSLFTDHSMWRHQVPALAEAGWRTIAVDPPGHGRSPGPGRGFTMDECAHAVLEVLDASAALNPVVLLGTSWGGFIAPRVAALAPDRVRAIAVFNSSADRPSLFDRSKATLLTTLLKARGLDGMTGPMIVSGLLSGDTRRRNPQLGAELTRQFFAWDRTAFVNSVRSVLIERTSALETLSRIDVPALIASGGQDRTLPTAHSERMAAGLPNARRVEFDAAGHLSPLEAPDDVNSAILDFVAGLAPL